MGRRIARALIAAGKKVSGDIVITLNNWVSSNGNNLVSSNGNNLVFRS